MNRKLFFLSFIFSLFVFLGFAFIPIQAEAETQFNLISTSNFFNPRESFEMNFIYYNATGEWSSSSEVVSSGYYSTANGWYQVFHVKHMFGAIASTSNFSGYDSYSFDLRDSSRNISIFEEDPGIDNGYIQNVDLYLAAFAGGNEYKLHLQHGDLYIDDNYSGFLSVYPVLEFDVVLNLDSAISSDSNYFKVNATYSGSENQFTVYGVNYSTFGEEQIIDGIDENTTAVNNAKSDIIYYIQLLQSAVTNQFSQLFINMQSWYDGLTNTINDGIDRLINNYSGTGTTDAANKFDDSAGDLEQVESDLSTITNSSIGSYTESAFDTSVITSLGSSLVYVVTWFTNFWNMGGLFTSILNVGLALSVAFFILRLRGGS